MIGPPAQPHGVRRGWRVAAVVASVLAVGSAAGLGYLSYHNGQVAGRWKRIDASQVVATRRVVVQLNTANNHITTLNTRVGALDTDVSSLQNQLSTVANQKEKALDLADALRQLLGAAGTVANDLQGCIGATNQFESDFNAAILNGNGSIIGVLTGEANQVDQTCGQAEQANQLLQTSIQNVP